MYPAPGGPPDPPGPPAATPPDDPASRVRFQEAGVTQPRPPTVAEARARDKARERRQQADLADAEARRRRSRRTKILIGSGAVVGVVGLVAVAYAVVGSDDEVTARCTTSDGVVVEDRFCDGSPNTSGIFLVGGRSYRYNYGGYGSLGQRVSGGSTVYPRGASVSTSSGADVSSTGTTTRRSGSGGSGSGGSSDGGGSSAGSGSSSGSGSVSRGGLGSSSGKSSGS
ncbi:hypothetical protein [Rhodococcus aerolatus]